MSNILAIDWDEREARFVVAATRGENARVKAALTVPFVELSEEEADSPENAGKKSKAREKAAPAGPDPRLGAQLRDILRKHRSGRGPVLVGVNRGNVELVHLTLPPAGDAELAELVHNQIVRELHVGPDDGVVDFLPMTADPDKPRAVTAALLPKAQVDRLRRTCSAAGIVPRRFLLRAYAAASLFSRTASPPEDVCLLANRIGDEVDLTVLARGEVVFSRTIRLPVDLDESVLIERLTAEVKRTVAVSLQDTADAGPVEGVYLFGGPNEYQNLIDAIQEELGMAAMVIDPFVAVDNAGQVPPQNAGEFAPLLGMILDEVRGGSHAIDFLNPRQQPEPPNRRRLYGTVAAAVLLVVASAGYYVWGRIDAAKENNAVVYSELRDLEKLVQTGKKKEQMVAAVREWQAADVCWLDELRDLALRLPSSRDIVIHRMTLSPARGGGGSVNYSGQVRDPSIILRMESAIRDSFHEIESRRVQERLGERDYTWQFGTSMAVAKREAEQFTSHLPQPPKDEPQLAGETAPNGAPNTAASAVEKPTGEDSAPKAAAAGAPAPGQSGSRPSEASILGPGSGGSRGGVKKPRATSSESPSAGAGEEKTPRGAPPKRTALSRTAEVPQ